MGQVRNGNGALKALARVVAVFALIAASLPGHAAPQSNAPIPRKDIFGNPTRNVAKVSPDGKMLAWLAPRDGVMNVWVAAVVRPQRARPVTAEKVRPIREYFWSPDSRRILYVQDEGGNENYRVFGSPVSGGETVSYTPFDKTQAQIVGASPLVRDAILVGLNNRDPKFHDVHRLDLASGKLALVRRNDGWSSWIVDMQLNVRGATKQTPAGGFEVYRFDGEQAVKLMDIAPEDGLTSGALNFDADGRTLYMLSSQGRDTAALVALDFAGGSTRVLGEHGRADIATVLTHPRTGRPDAFAANYLRRHWTPLGPALRADFAHLAKRIKGDFSVESRSDDDRLWTLRVDRVTAPVAYYLYDRRSKKVAKLFSTRPALEGRKLASMHPVEIKARDGLTLVAYLSLPPGADADGNGRPDRPIPLVLNVHGGPWWRDSYGYVPEHQWLANRGYAVLSVNYRGSTGFGKAFLNAANFEFAGKMHSDLIDAVDWAIREKIAPADKVAIYGGSYGGYATLVGMTFTPDTFACGVDIVGPSSLVTLIESFPAYWQPFLEATWYKRVGDPRTDEGRKALLARSPISRVDAIKRPLLIAQGANDPRVTQKESDQLVAAMQAKQLPVTYALFADEGHGFARPQNRIGFYAVSEAFLTRCLGGRHEPVGEDFRGSSIEVKVGADHLPGLAQALAAKR